MQDSIFREYDIRGIVGKELCIDQAYAVAQAMAVYFVAKNPTVQTIAVGMDGRTHSPELKKELCRGFMDSGLNVVDIGCCTSPVLYFALHNSIEGITPDAGVMVTASHNPKEYNGIKICLGTESVWGDGIREIRDLFRAGASCQAETLGCYRKSNVIDVYIDWLVAHFSHLKDMPLSVLVDCGNGAAGTVLPQLVKRFNWANVDLLFAEVDGTYPHHEADPTVAANMAELKERLAVGSYAFGAGLDGDADRMAPMTRDGYLVPGDQLLALFARHLAEDDQKKAIVFDVKASSGLLEVLKELGVRPIMSQTGHALIKKNMKCERALLGGELSCHFCFNDRYFGYDDGIYAMLRLFEIMLDFDGDLAQAMSFFPHKISTPEIRIACKEEEKKAIIQAVYSYFCTREDAQCYTCDGVRVQVPHGWGLVRASNTQPCMSLRFEGDTHVHVQQIKEDFYQAMVPFFTCDYLKRHLAM